jgi:hypothetical protein
MTPNKGLRRHLLFDGVQLSVTLQGRTVRLVEENEFVSAFNIEDIAVVYAVHLGLVGNTDPLIAFFFNILQSPIQNTIQFFFFHRFYDIVEGKYFVSLGIMLIA